MESATGKLSACVVLHLFSDSLGRRREIMIAIVKPAGEYTNLHEWQVSTKAGRVDGPAKIVD